LNLKYKIISQIIWPLIRNELMDILRLIFCVPKHLSKHPHALLD